MKKKTKKLTIVDLIKFGLAMGGIYVPVKGRKIDKKK